MPETPMVFVVGTGRCGSTILSDMVRLHPGVLSLSELFTSLGGPGPMGRKLSGSEFWDFIATPRYGGRQILRAAPFKEILYPTGRNQKDTAAFSIWDDGVPPISLITLPHLTPAFDRLYDHLGRRLKAAPPAPLSEHYLELFDALGEDRPGRTVVERSGGSLEYIEQLIDLFPEAAVIHLHRDGRDTALSMSRHPRYRFIMVERELTRRIGGNPYSMTEEEYLDELPALVDAAGDMVDLLPHRITDRSFRSWSIPLSRFGSLWSTMVLTKTPALRRHQPLLEMSYEDMARDPHGSLMAIAEFIGLDRAPEWSAAASAIFNPEVARWRGESTEVQAVLERSCRPGMRFLRDSPAPNSSPPQRHEEVSENV